MLTVTRTFQFCAGHRLHRADWPAAKNRDVFGPCSNPAGHGHNYTLEVSVSGRVDPETGMVLNLRQLKELVTDRVIADVDHKNLNADVPWMKDVIPTTERFAERLWERLTAVLATEAPGVKLAGLVLHETPNNKAAISGIPG
jgi:6-pyruvoyltetrahydropterin/6-carboxytetrahydropterin synthase